MQAAPGYPGPAHDATPKIGEWMSEAFTLFGREWLNWCLMTLIYLVVVSIPVGIGSTVLVGMVLSAMAAAAGPAGQPAGGLPGFITSVSLVVLVIVLAVAVLEAYFHAGMANAAVKQFRGESIQVGDLFSGGSVAVSVTVTEILYLLGTSLGYCMCVLPGFLLSGLWIFAPPLAVERRMTPVEALRTSMETTKSQMWMYLVWFLLCGLIAYSGSIVVIGVLATVPIARLMLMISYRDVFGIPGAIPTVTHTYPGEAVGYGAPGAYPPQQGYGGYPPPPKGPAGSPPSP